VPPGYGLVVEGAGPKASVQDADEPVGQPPQGIVMFDSPSAELVVERAGRGRGGQGGEGLGHESVDEPVVVDEPGGDDFPFPEARVIGEVAALRSGGLKGSKETLNALARMVNAERADGR